MPHIFNVLPGIEVPVSAVSRGLSDMWRDPAAEGPSTEDARATQVNFIIYLGSQTTPDDAARQFEATKQFSHRHPSRVVVLCPLAVDDSGQEMRAKIYGECFLGRSKSDKRCVEFVILSYPRSAREHLENFVSTCLSSDLPLYLWGHRFSASPRLAEYRYLLTLSKRVLVDTAIAPADVLTFTWPRPDALRDLAHARLLPVRQALGQFLSRYPMEALCRGLSKVTVSHGENRAAEARVIAAWLRERLRRCGDSRAAFETVPVAGADRMAVGFSYDDRRNFSWDGDFGTGRARFQADFGTGRTELPASASLLSPEAALSEAMFF